MGDDSAKRPSHRGNGFFQSLLSTSSAPHATASAAAAAAAAGETRPQQTKTNKLYGATAPAPAKPTKFSTERTTKLTRTSAMAPLDHFLPTGPPNTSRPKPAEMTSSLSAQVKRLSNPPQKRSGSYAPASSTPKPLQNNHSTGRDVWGRNSSPQAKPAPASIASPYFNKPTEASSSSSSSNKDRRPSASAASTNKRKSAAPKKFTPGDRKSAVSKSPVVRDPPPRPQPAKKKAPDVVLIESSSDDEESDSGSNEPQSDAFGRPIISFFAVREFMARREVAPLKAEHEHTDFPLKRAMLGEAVCRPEMQGFVNRQLQVVWGDSMATSMFLLHVKVEQDACKSPPPSVIEIPFNLLQRVKYSIEGPPIVELQTKHSLDAPFLNFLKDGKFDPKKIRIHGDGGRTAKSCITLAFQPSTEGNVQELVNRLNGNKSGLCSTEPYRHLAEVLPGGQKSNGPEGSSSNPVGGSSRARKQVAAAAAASNDRKPGKSMFIDLTGSYDDPNTGSRRSGRLRTAEEKEVQKPYALDPNECILTWPEGKGAITVTNSDLDRLEPGEFLNDVIINLYLKYMHIVLFSAMQKREVHFFNTFFYKQLTTGKTKEHSYMRVQRWVTKNILEHSMIVVPVNEHAHWYLGIICYPSLVCISEEQSQAAAAAQSKAAAAAAAKSKTPEAKSKTAAASAAKTKAAAAPTTWKKPGIVDSFIQAERRNDNTDSDQDEVDDDEEELASVLQRPRANAGGTATAAAAAANRGNSASSAAPMDVDSNVPSRKRVRRPQAEPATPALSVSSDEEDALLASGDEVTTHVRKPSSKLSSKQKFDELRSSSAGADLLMGGFDSGEAALRTVDDLEPETQPEIAGLRGDGGGPPKGKAGTTNNNNMVEDDDDDVGSNGKNDEEEEEKEEEEKEREHASARKRRRNLKSKRRSLEEAAAKKQAAGLTNESSGGKDSDNSDDDDDEIEVVERDVRSHKAGKARGHKDKALDAGAAGAVATRELDFIAESPEIPRPKPTPVLNVDDDDDDDDDDGVQCSPEFGTAARHEAKRAFARKSQSAAAQTVSAASGGARSPVPCEDADDSDQPPPSPLPLRHTSKEKAKTAPAASSAKTPCLSGMMVDDDSDDEAASAQKSQERKRRSLSSKEQGNQQQAEETEAESQNRPCILMFDSLGGVHNHCVDYLRDYLTEAGKDAHKKSKDTTPPFEYTKATMPGIEVKVPNQPNTCDCGVYLLHYVEKFFGLDLEKHLKELLGGKAGRRKSSAANAEDDERVTRFPVGDKRRAKTGFKQWFKRDAIEMKRKHLRQLIEHLAFEQHEKKLKLAEKKRAATPAADGSVPGPMADDADAQQQAAEAECKEEADSDVEQLREEQPETQAAAATTRAPMDVQGDGGEQQEDEDEDEDEDDQMTCARATSREDRARRRRSSRSESRKHGQDGVADAGDAADNSQAAKRTRSSHDEPSWAPASPARRRPRRGSRAAAENDDAAEAAAAAASAAAEMAVDDDTVEAASRVSSPLIPEESLRSHEDSDADDNSTLHMPRVNGFVGT